VDVDVDVDVSVGVDDRTSASRGRPRLDSDDVGARDHASRQVVVEAHLPAP
jgi:hypothetical protein